MLAGSLKIIAFIKVIGGSLKVLAGSLPETPSTEAGGRVRDVRGLPDRISGHSCGDWPLVA